jgi:hypothetical protein
MPLERSVKMGSTGHGLYKSSKSGNTGTETFGIPGAVRYAGKVPENSGLDKVGNNKITLKLEAGDKSNILFQFKLTKAGDEMIILGYNNSTPVVKCKVAVDAGSPSLDKLLATGNRTERLNAVKMKDLFAKSTEVKESQLSAIAHTLLKNKAKREGVKK